MNESDDWWTRPSWLLTAGVAVGLAGAGLLWGLSYLVPAIGAAAGYLAAGAIHGAVSGAIAGWFSSVALYGGTVVLVGGGMTLGIRVVKEAARKPFFAAVVILAAFQTFLLDMVKELWPGDNVSKWLFKASTALLFAIAAAIWSRGGWKHRTCAGFIFASMPLMVVALSAVPFLDLGMREAFDQIPRNVWLALGGFACFALAALLLEVWLNETEYAV